jgi:hypothetical protein
VLKNAQGHYQLQREVEERRRAETALGHRVEIETLVSTLSTRLISVDTEGLDSEIHHGLQVIGTFPVWTGAYSV